MKKDIRKETRTDDRWTISEYAGIAVLLILSAMILTSNLSLPKLDQLAVRDTLQEFKAAREIELAQQGMDATERARLIESDAAAFQKSAVFSMRVEEAAAAYKDTFKDPQGRLYLFQPDSYHFYRGAQNILRDGTMGNARWSTGMLYDTVSRYSYADVQPALLPYMLAGLAKALHDNLWLAAFIYPVLFGCIAMLFVYLIGRKIAGSSTGFVAALLLILNPFFFANMYAGLADSNAVNIVLSLLLVLSFMYLMEAKKAKMFVWGALFIATFVLFWFAWSGFFYLLPVFGLYLGIRTLQRRQYQWIALIVIALLFLTLTHVDLVQKTMAYLNIGQQQAIGTLPNPFLFVSEFSLNYHYFQQFGSMSMLGLALFCIAMIVGSWKLIGKRDGQPLSLLIICWFLILLIPAIKAFRFFYLIVPVLSIAAGAGVIGISNSTVWDKLQRIMRRKVPVFVRAGAMTLIIAAGMLPMLQDQRLNAIPGVDDSVYNTAMTINQMSKPDAVIATWWDNGYYYQTLSERATFFDGASFDSMYPIWMSRVMLEGNDRTAANLLRMLNCGGANTALGVAETFSPKQPFEWIEQAMLHPNSAEQQITKKKWDDESQSDRLQKELLLNQFYCNATETYLVLSEDMLRKFYIFDYYNRWLPDRDPSKIGLRPNLISPVYNCNSAGKKLYCELGVTLDLEQGKAYDPSGNENAYIVVLPNQTIAPQSVMPNKPIIVFFRELDGRIRYVAVMPEIINSMFVKLFLLNGAGLTHFEKIGEFSDKYAKRVISYKVLGAALNVTLDMPDVIMDVTHNRTESTPTIKLRSPKGGEKINTTFNVTWLAYDADNDTLKYLIFISDDNGSTFRTLADDIKTKSYTLHADDFVFGDHYLIRVIATDGINSASDMNDVFFSIIPPDIRPHLSKVGDVMTHVNATVTIRINASNPIENSLVFGTDATFGTMDNITGFFRWTPTIPGIFKVNFTATNGYASDSQGVTITVNPITRALLSPRIVRGDVKGYTPWYGDSFFIDDFERYGNSRTYKSMTEDGGTMWVAGQYINKPNKLVFLTVKDDWQNFTYTLKCNLGEPDNCGMIFNWEDTNSTGGYAYYLAPTSLVFGKYVDGAKYSLKVLNDSIVDVHHGIGMWYWLRVHTNGTHILLQNSSDGRIFSTRFISKDAQFTDGAVGLLCGATCLYDDLSITQHLCGPDNDSSMEVAHDDDNLTATYIYSNLYEYHQNNITIRWFRDGLLIDKQVNVNTAITNSTISHKMTNPGNRFYVEVMACDTGGNCTTERSPQVKIIP